MLQDNMLISLLSTSGYELMITDYLPCTLRRLVLFETFNEQYLAIVNSGTHRVIAPELSRTVAELGFNLEVLSTSFLVDADRFFEGCKSFYVWPRLISLTLTAQSLVPSKSADIESVLQRAAKVAVRMPKLETMEIWNGMTGLAALFRYQSNPAMISWRGTWDFTFQASVIQAWEAVTLKSGTNLAVIYERLDKSKIRCVGDAIYHLGHSERVLRPVSLQQIQLESARRVAHN